MIARERIATLVVPRGAEAAAVRRGLAACHARDGELRVVAVPAGAAARDALPDTLAEPLVVVGLCGALRDRRVGDVVVYAGVVDDGGTVDADDALTAELLELFPAAFAVTACTTDHVVTTVRERDALVDAFDADVVDMEGSHLARALSARGTRFAVLRVVSDDAARELPALEHAFTADGRLHAGRLAFAFARKPRAALAFIRDVRVALAALSGAATTLARQQH